MIAKALRPPALDDIRAAAERLAPFAGHSPLLPLRNCPRRRDVFLKLENLQPIGAFKTRPMANILLSAEPRDLWRGVYTASSGNAGLGLAFMAGHLGIGARIYAPAAAPRDKLTAIEELGAEVIVVPADEWWQIIEAGDRPDDPGKYIDAVRDPAALAGNGTIGLEIAAQCAGADTVYVPFGGGGLSCGIAVALRALGAGARIVVAESDAATPLTAALQAGYPVTVATSPSFISGAGAPSVLAEMWPLIGEFIDDTVVVPVRAVASAVRDLCEYNKVIAEGAGAIAVAAAFADDAGAGTAVCVVSGGNIDPSVMAKILLRKA